MENQEFNWYDNSGQPSPETSYPTWDNPSQEDIPTYNAPQSGWDNPIQETNFNINESQLDVIDINKEINKHSSYLGTISKYSINIDSWFLNHNNEQALYEFNNLNSIYNEEQNLCEYTPAKESEIGKILSHISYLGKQKNLQLDKYHILQVSPNQSIPEFFKIKSDASFLYIINSDLNIDSLSMDFSSLGGPIQPFISITPGVLSIYPSWVPLKFPTNATENKVVALFGTFNKK